MPDVFGVTTLALTSPSQERPGVSPNSIVTRMSVKSHFMVGGNSLRATVTFSPAADVFASSTDLIFWQPGMSSPTISWPSLASEVSFLIASEGVDSNTFVSFLFNPTATSAPHFYTACNDSVTLMPANVAAVSISPSTVPHLQTAVGQVILDGAAGPSGRVVTLTSSDSTLTVPASVTVAAQQRRATFTITNSGSPTNSGTATITAQVGSGASASASVNYECPKVTSLTPATTNPVGGTKLGYVLTTNAAYPADRTVNFSWGGTATGTFPSSVVIPAGRRTVAFIVTPDAVDTAKTLTATATNPDSSTVVSTVNVVPAQLDAVLLSPAWSGLKGSGSVRLTGPAGPSGMVVNLTSSNTEATFPATVTVAPGSRTATFAYSTQAVDLNTTLNLSATQGSITKTTQGTIRRATISNLVPSSMTTSGGRVNFTIKMNGLAGPSGITFNLMSSDARVPVPPTVRVLPGKGTATFFSNATSSSGGAVPVSVTASGPSGVGTVTVTITLN